MLNFDIYNNVMHMMHHRGMEQADEMLEELDKIKITAATTFHSDPQFHNIGADFKTGIVSDLKTIEDRIMMSFCMTDEVRKHKQFVFFGTSSKSFLEYMTTIMLKYDFPDYTCFYTLVTNKVFTAKLKEKVSVIVSKFNLNIFMDEELTKPPFHAYGADYQLMEDSELEKLLSELRINRKQMKLISSSDPIIKYYGWPSGKGVRLYQKPMIVGSLVDTTLDYRLIM